MNLRTPAAERPRESYVETLDENDPRYLSALDKHLKSSSYISTFGSNELFEHEQLRQNTKASVGAVVPEIKDISGFWMPRALLLRYLSQPGEMQEAVNHLFEECLNNAHFIQNARSEGIILNTIDDFKKSVENNEFSYDLWLEVFRLHKENFDNEKRVMEANFERWKSEFKQRVSGEVAAGNLPADMEEVDRRLREVKFTFSDFLVHSNLGDYTLWNVNISNRLPMEKRRHAVFHELVHAIAGREIVAVHGSAERMDLRRTGLGIKYYEPNGACLKGDFLGIDEAITEEIALMLSKEPDQGYYIFERSKYRLIANSQELQSVFLKAYFENTSSALEEKAARPHWENLKNLVEVERLRFE